MLQKTSTILKFILGNLLQTFQVLVLILIVYFSTEFILGLLFSLAWIYLFPPAATRFIYFLLGRPDGKMRVNDKRFWAWYMGAQLQSIFMRFSFLEEILRVFPLLYSAWLRLWGAKIGKNIYWAPAVILMDRTHLQIGNYVLIGYGAGFTAHHLNNIDGQMELILSTPEVGENAILGGLSGLGPGAKVAPGETLPSTMTLAPFYEWRDGRRYSTLLRE